jgi:chorismate mutase/prephenate dehydratase
MSEPQAPQPSLVEELSVVRGEIDRVDNTILELLNQRARCAQTVGEIKARHGDAGFIYRPEREAQVLRRLQELNQGPLADETVTRLFREVMSACLSLEQPLSIAYLGPEGSFTGSAALKHFGHAARLVPQAAIDELFREVEAGHVDYAVAPVENSTEGAVGRTMDLLLGTPLKICGEVVLRVHQNLLTKAGSLAEIKHVYSHAQSLSQCHEWLNRNLPGVPRTAVASNSLAAQMVAESNDPTLAAIAGEAAGERYGLPKLAASIEDEPNNTTRFVVLGRHDAGISGRDKTSLIMSAPNRTGALHYLLTPLTDAGVSLTRLESRPARHTLWEYVFFVDIEGHRDEPRIAAALEELARRAAYLKILGAYPAAVY